MFGSFRPFYSWLAYTLSPLLDRNKRPPRLLLLRKRAPTPNSLPLPTK